MLDQLDLLEETQQDIKFLLAQLEQVLQAETVIEELFCKVITIQVAQFLVLVLLLIQEVLTEELFMSMEVRCKYENY